MTALDRTVDTGTLTLATRDFGGSGRAVLLLHGAGQSLADFTPLAALLTPTCHVVAMDLRGHGRSGDGTFTWEHALDDTAAVIADYDLVDPILVGHSLGGMIAAKFGGTRSTTIGAAVNIDGHGNGAPAQYDGVDPQTAQTRIAAMTAATDALLDRGIPPVPAAMFPAVVAAQATALGIDPDLVAAALQRTLITTGDIMSPRVPVNTVREITALVDALTLDDDYRACKVPLLVFNATAAQPPVPGMPDWLPEHLAAYRRGLRTQLSALATDDPQFHYAEVPATHSLHVTHPQQVAPPLLTFITSVS